MDEHSNEDDDGRHSCATCGREFDGIEGWIDGKHYCHPGDALVLDAVAGPTCYERASWA